MHRICWCSLAGSKICETCGIGSWMSLPSTTTYPTSQTPDWHLSDWHSGRKVTEKFDKDGKLIERVTEE